MIVFTAWLVCSMWLSLRGAYSLPRDTYQRLARICLVLTSIVLILFVGGIVVAFITRDFGWADIVHGFRRTETAVRVFF